MITVLSPSPALDVSYLVGEVAAGRIHRPREVLRRAGGKGLNLARAAAVLGVRARVVAPLGGSIGAEVARLAAAEGLDLVALPTDAETRLCVSAIADDGTATEFYEPAAPVPAGWLDRVELPAGGWTVLTGRLPDGDIPVPAGRLAVDASGRGLRDLLELARPALVKINVHEAGELLGRTGDALTLARAIHAGTGGAVVLTAGIEGAVAVDATGAWRALPDPEPGRYAIGSGDSFLAGLLAGLDADDPLPEALRRGSAAGSANTRVPGAAVFTRDDFEAALRRLEVHPA